MIQKKTRTAFYYFHLAWVRAILLVAASLDIRGKKNVPREGPLILASNHLNNADPVILTHAIPRQIAWLTKAEWFSTPVIGPMFRWGGMIPVRRFEADLGALRKAQDHLKDGGCLGMFPEGTRSREMSLKEGEPGSALIALRTGAPIIPVAVWGTENVKLPRDILRRTRAHIRFGEPFTLERSARISRKDVAAGTERIMQEIAALLPEKYRGIYGGADQSPKEAVESNP
jgi:1-acyl-sn-glycerol-3-phosphate acyltransferase